MDIYKNIKTEESYNDLLKSGMFGEFHPELTGDWNKDKNTINSNMDIIKKWEEMQETNGPKVRTEPLPSIKKLRVEALELIETGKTAPIIEENSLFDEDYKSDYEKITESICELLEYKNDRYGNAALEPLGIFTGKSKVGQRLDDKLARVKNSDILLKNDVVDIIGYLVIVCRENNWTDFSEFKD